MYRGWSKPMLMMALFEFPVVPDKSCWLSFFRRSPLTAKPADPFVISPRGQLGASSVSSWRLLTENHVIDRRTAIIALFQESGPEQPIDTTSNFQSLATFRVSKTHLSPPSFGIFSCPLTKKSTLGRLTHRCRRFQSCCMWPGARYLR